MREKRGYTQEKMAKMIGIGTSTYIRKENGYDQFKLDEINSILAILSTDYNTIFLTDLSLKYATKEEIYQKEGG